MGAKGVEPGTAHTLVTHREVNFAADLVNNMRVSGQVSGVCGTCALRCGNSSRLPRTPCQVAPPDLIQVAKRSKRWRQGGGAAGSRSNWTGQANAGIGFGNSGGGRSAGGAGWKSASAKPQQAGRAATRGGSWSQWRAAASTPVSGFVASSTNEMGGGRTSAAPAPRPTPTPTPTTAPTPTPTPASASARAPATASASASASASAPGLLTGSTLAELRAKRRQVLRRKAGGMNFVAASSTPTASGDPAAAAAAPTRTSAEGSSGASTSGSTGAQGAQGSSGGGSAGVSADIAAAIAQAKAAAARISAAAAAASATPAAPASKRGRWDDGGDARTTKVMRAGWSSSPQQFQQQQAYQQQAAYQQQHGRYSQQQGYSQYPVQVGRDGRPTYYVKGQRY